MNRIASARRVIGTAQQANSVSHLGTCSQVRRHNGRELLQSIMWSSSPPRSSSHLQRVTSPSLYASQIGLRPGALLKGEWEKKMLEAHGEVWQFMMTPKQRKKYEEKLAHRNAYIMRMKAEHGEEEWEVVCAEENAALQERKARFAEACRQHRSRLQQEHDEFMQRRIAVTMQRARAKARQMVFGWELEASGPNDSQLGVELDEVVAAIVGEVKRKKEIRRDSMRKRAKARWLESGKPAGHRERKKQQAMALWLAVGDQRGQSEQEIQKALQ